MAMPPATEPSEPSGLEPSPASEAAIRGPGAFDAPADGVAIGMLMALTPCTSHAARDILAAAAHAAGVTTAGMALAYADSARGVPLPTAIERALRNAVAAARSPSRSALGGLLPGTDRTADALTRLRECQTRLRRSPGDAAVRRAMDDVAYTLCVLMARRTLHEAVTAAELRLSLPPST